MKVSQRAESFRKNRIRRHAWQQVVFAAACVVVFCTVYALILPAITMEEDVFCGLQEHTHEEKCFEQRLTCALEEDMLPHVHGEACYETQQVLVCELEQIPAHTHTAECFDEDGETLLCGLEDIPGHIHTEECYREESVLVCTAEEDVVPHVHTEACYESVLICEQEEHTHGLLCYSDPKADVEKSSQWERTLPNTLTGDWAQDIIAVAQSQLGYAESSRNYKLAEDGSKKGYTRYGAWYGNPCGEWCAMFVSFCSHYAGIPQEAKLHEMSCMRMVNNLTGSGVYHEAGNYQPQPGDIVFFRGEENTVPCHVGIVVGTGEKLTTIEGNKGNKVSKGSYDPTDKCILGYASMAEIVAQYQPAPTELPEITPEGTELPEETPLVSFEPEETPEPTVEPNIEDTPEPTVETEETVEPTAEPDLTAEPEETPELTAEPNIEDTPEPTVETEETVEPTAEPDLTAEPEETPELTAEPNTEPEPEETAEPSTEPEETPEPTAEPNIETEPEETAEPFIEPEETPEPTAEPNIETEPEETAEPFIEPVGTPEPTIEPNIEVEPEETSEPTVEPEETTESTAEPEDTPEPTAEPTAEPEETPEPTLEPDTEIEPAPTATPLPARPEITILSDEEDSSDGECAALAQGGDTVYFRVSLVQPAEEAEQAVSDESEDIREIAEEAARHEGEEDDSPAFAPMHIILPDTKGLFEWRLEDTTEPGAVWVVSDGTVSLIENDDGKQCLELFGADTALVRLTLPADEVYSAFAKGLSNRAETILSYEGQQASVAYTLITDKPVCGITAHAHEDTCYDEAGALTCTLPVHGHTELCYLSNKTTFTYQDGELSMSVIAYSRDPLHENTLLNVEPLEDEEACLRYAEFAQTLSAEEGATLLLRRLSLTAEGETLPEDSYRLVATVQVNADVTNAMVALLALDAEDEGDTPDKGILVTALNGFADIVTEGDSVLAAIGEAIPALTVALRNNDLVLLATSTPNPTYTVQYYAWIPVFAKSGDASLPVFDTSGKKLPTNSGTNKTINLFLKSTNKTTSQNAGNATTLYKVATEDTLTEMYSSNAYEYIKAPNPSYIDKLLDNVSYELKEIWVLKSGKNSASTNKNDWDVYAPDAIHFTNRDGIADANKGIVYLSSDSVIRMVYDVADDDLTISDVKFYDYDITNGEKVNDNGTTRWKTAIAGINSKGNYGTSTNGSTNWYSYNNILAFGNVNTGTGLAYSKFDGVEINKYSGKNYGCTFGIAKSMKDGMIVYNDWLIVPNLFNDGDAAGKTNYSGSLTFSRVGDTYTLSKASAPNKTLSDLDQFFNPSPYSGKIWDTIYTNNFWPMDGVTGNDPKFGDYKNKTYWSGYLSSESYLNGITDTSWKTEIGTFPDSDDGKPHNSYFGMQFALEFTLTEDYVGPLEYYFFGDDDLWVFLDNKLVCDIGGVHSSVGEYVNLWDYLVKGEAGTHKLTFFYTERGASGSTCYMNFTLPSVTGATISQKTGSLKVEKEVVGEHETTEEFEFNIHFTKADGTTAILDDYAYDRYSAAGKLIESNLIIHDDGSFNLRDGEYVIIKYLPYGVQYHITEVSKTGYTTTCTVDGVVQEGKTAHSTIYRGATNTVTFTNTVARKQLKLRKLGIEGASAPITLSGVTFTLTDSSGSAVNVVDKGDGVYEVPLSSDGYIVDGAQYYIALASNPEYVICASEIKEGTQLTLHSKDTSASNKKWTVYRQSDGSYSFLNGASTNQWIDLDHGTTTNLTPVIIWGNGDTPSTNENHKWFFQPNGDGSFTIKPRAAVVDGSKAVLDLSGNTVANGTVIQVYESNGSDAQKWLLVPVNKAKAPTTTTAVTTNAQGELTIENLLPGTYTLTELSTEVNAGYKPMEPIKVKVKANGTLVLEEDATDGLVTVSEDKLLLQVQNVPIDKKLTIMKKVNGSTDVTDFTFKISYEQGEETIERTITLKDGGSEVVDIPHGVTVTITEEGHDGFAVAYSGIEGETETLIGNQSSITMEAVTADMVILATNTVHYSLPETGGTGNLLYTTGGLLLCGSSLMWGLRKRRRRLKASRRP